MHGQNHIKFVDWIFITGSPAWRLLDEYMILHKSFKILF